MIVNVEKVSDAVRTNEIFQQTTGQIVIKIDDSEQDENNRLDDFNELRQTLLRGADKAFLKLLRTGHYNNTQNGIPKGSNGETPLHLVCAEGRVHLTKKLLGYGERKIVDYSDAMKMYDQTMGFTPFLTAAMNGHHQCFQILVDKLLRSLQTNAFNGHDILSLFNSEKQSRYHCLSSLASMDKRTNLLHIVAQQQHVEILECLFRNVENKPKLCSDVIEPMLIASDPSGSTPLHIAARLNHSDIVKQLFKLAILCSKLSHTQETSAKKDSNESEEDQQDDDDEENVAINRSVDTNYSNINTRNTNSSANLAGRNSSTLSGTDLPQRSTHTPIVKQPISKKVSKIYATMVRKQNAYQCAPIHEAVQEGHKEMVEQFINDAVFDQQKILTIKNKDGQTALHLAALKGHVEIVEFILKHIDEKNIILKDTFGSTPLHCAAQASKKDHDNSAKILRQFIEIQKRWIKASEWLSESSVELLKERNNHGYNCLEEAIINMNRPFVECIFDLHPTQWKVLMQNAQINDKVPEVNTPTRKLIRYMPDMACQVFNKCIETTIIPNGQNEPKKKKVTYDFQFLEDHCHVQQWNPIPENKSQKTDNQSETSEKANSCWKKFSKSLHSITFRDNSRSDDEPLIPFSNSPRTLVNNHPLSTIISNVRLSGIILDEHKVKSQTRLLEHPLCHQLSLFKWKQFGFYIFFINFLTYVLFLALFTWATLRNIEPRKFYNAVNVSYGNIDSSRPSEGCKEVFYLLNARDDQSIKELDHRKDQTDYVLKYILYILLWLHILKGVLMIGVYRLRIRGRFYAEVIALILCFIYLYDNPNWQKDTRFRCVDQWQTGAFGLFLAWSTLLAYIRFIPYFGLYVVMLEVIINKFLWFAPVLIILICSFAFPFYMLLQNQVPFQNVPFAWLRSAFMLTDMGYEARFYGSDGQQMIVLYPVLIALFIFYGVTVYILVTNLLIGLAVGEIPTLVQLSRLHGLIIQYEFLNSSQIFRLQYLCTPSKIYFTEEIIESIDPSASTGRLEWLRRCFNFRLAHPTDDTIQD